MTMNVKGNIQEYNGSGIQHHHVHGHTGHGHMDHGHTGHGHMEHGHTGHGHMEHGHTGHGHMEHGHIEHGNIEHAHDNLENHGEGGMSMHGHDMMEGMLGHSHASSTFSLKTDADFLLEGVKISSIQGIILGMVFTFVVSILFDSIKYLMYVRESKRANRLAAEVTVKKQNLDQCIATVYHMLSITLSYIMMLCVMTMNVWILISVLVGSGIGYLFIRPLLSRTLGVHRNRSVVLKPRQSDGESEPLSSRCIPPENGPVCESIEDPSTTRLIYDRESVI